MELISEDYNRSEYTVDTNNVSLYHISENDKLDGVMLYPKVPTNFLVSYGYEDSTTKRVCFCSSVKNCLRALSSNCTGKMFYVYKPIGIKPSDVYTPTIKEVPDVKVTGEKWILKPVKIKRVGKIYVEKDSGEPGLKYHYGKHTAELYDWDFRYINESYVAEDYSRNVYTAKYDSLDEFCKVIKTFDDLVVWFQANEVKWPEYKDRMKSSPVDYTGPITWPDKFVKTKTGNCLDQSLFVYAFCKRVGLPCWVYRFSRFYDISTLGTQSTLWCSSHFVTLIERNSGYWMFSYAGPQLDISGPFKSPRDFTTWYMDHFRLMFDFMTGLNDKLKYSMNTLPPDMITKTKYLDKSKYKSRVAIKYGKFTDDDMNFIFRNEGIKNITQNEFILKSKGCRFKEDGMVIDHTPLDVLLNKFREFSGKAFNTIWKTFTTESMDLANEKECEIMDEVTEGIFSTIKNRLINSKEPSPKDKVYFVIHVIISCHDIITKMGDKSFYHCFRKLNTPMDKKNLKKFCKGRYKYAQILYYNKKWYKGDEEDYIDCYRKFRAAVKKIDCPKGLGITFAKGSNENDGYLEVVCHNWKPAREGSVFVTESQKPRACTSDLDLTDIQFIKAPHVKGGGFCNNSLLIMDGKKYRVRVETLVYNDRGQILATKRDKASKYGLWYNLPGGSMEPNKSIKEQAEAECNEEVFAKVKNVKNTGIWFTNMYPVKSSENPNAWDYKLATKYGLDYDGAITIVCVAEYDGEFTGKVKAADKVDWGKKAMFYDPDDIGLSEVHREALRIAHVKVNESYFSDSLSEGNSNQPVKSLMGNKIHRKQTSRKAMKPMNGNHKNIVSNESASIFKTELVTESADDMVYVMISQGEDYFNSPQASKYIDSYKIYPIDHFMETGMLFSVYPVEGKLIDCETEIKSNIAKVLDLDKNSVNVYVMRNRGKMKVKGLPRIDIVINDSASMVNESTSVFVTENNDTQPLDILEKDEVHYPHKMYVTKKDFIMKTEDPSKEYDPPRNFNNLSDIAGLELQTFKGYKDLNDDIKIIYHSGGDYNRIGYIRCPESGIRLVKKWMADCSARSERFDYFIKDSKGNGGKFELWFNPKTYHDSEC